MAEEGGMVLGLLREAGEEKGKGEEGRRLNGKELGKGGGLYPIAINGLPLFNKK